MLEQHGQRHAYRAHEKKIAKALNVVPYRFSSFLNRLEELVHGHLSVILIESRKEPGFQVHPRIDEVTWKASEPVKGYLLDGADEQSGHDSIIIYYIACM